MIFLRRMLVPALAHLGALLLGVVHGEVPKSGAGGQRYERGMVARIDAIGRYCNMVLVGFVLCWKLDGDGGK